MVHQRQITPEQVSVAISIQYPMRPFINPK